MLNLHKFQGIQLGFERHFGGFFRCTEFRYYQNVYIKYEIPNFSIISCLFAKFRKSIQNFNC